MQCSPSILSYRATISKELNDVPVLDVIDSIESAHKKKTISLICLQLQPFSVLRVYLMTVPFSVQTHIFGAPAKKGQVLLGTQPLQFPFRVRVVQISLLILAASLHVVAPFAPVFSSWFLSLSCPITRGIGKVPYICNLIRASQLLLLLCVVCPFKNHRSVKGGRKKQAGGKWPEWIEPSVPLCLPLCVCGCVC